MDNQLTHLLNNSWHKLKASAKGANDNFKYIQVCNFSTEYIDAYTVVLREASATFRCLVFYTDARSPKVTAIRQQNKLTVISYSNEERAQIIFKGEAVIHHQDETAQLYWRKDGYKSRRSYLAQPAPSTVIDKPTDGLLHVADSQFDDADTAGFENFAVVKVNVNYLEYLQLSRNGNSRAKFSWQDTRWEGTWLIP